MIVTDPARSIVAAQIAEAVRQTQIVVVSGTRGLGQKATVTAALASLAPWEHLAVNGNWLTGGYLAGFQDLLDQALQWCSAHQSETIARYEQSIKRILPKYDSPHFRVPRDLTNTSSKDERTRFYHHEYQNKLLVGLSDFILEYLTSAATTTLLSIDDASSMSPTARHLLHVLTRDPFSATLIRFVLIDYGQQIFLPQAITIRCPEYSYEDMARLLNLERDYTSVTAQRIYMASRGNALAARAVLVCAQSGIPVAGYFDGRTMVDVYLATLHERQRLDLLAKFIANKCESDDYIDIRNYETCDADSADREHQERHAQCMTEYEAGVSPLIMVHALAIRDKYKRLDALVEPSETLKNIGLYDTLFTYLGEVFADPALRRHGSGDGASNALFINAAFVLYSMGCAKASTPYLDEFCGIFPGSKFIPTVLYAQTMTHGRYQQPVNLPLAEQYALLNIQAIETRFTSYEKFHYIKVFAENAYAYVKAKQGKYDEALALCTNGNARMHEIYGDNRFRLHQSILIYNTSQIYEIVKDYERAEAQLRLAISYDPSYGEYYNDLGNILSRLPGRFDEAVAAYGRAIDLCPPYYEAYLNRGMLLARLGHRAAAIEDFERVLEIKSDEWRAFVEMGNVRLAQGEHGKALDIYRKAMAIEPSNADLQCNIGLACSEAGDMEASVEHYRMAIALSPRHGVSHNNLAVELFAMGRRDEALRHATIAVEIGGDPDYERNLKCLS